MLNKIKKFIKKNITNKILSTFKNKSKSIEKKNEIYKEINKLRYNVKY
jgi:hypothetical protein